MSLYYFIPHIGIKQEPSPHADWSNLDLNNISNKCNENKSCVGYDSSKNIRTGTPSRYSLYYFNEPTKGSFFKDKGEFTSFCNQADGVIKAQRCDLSVDKAKTFVAKRNKILKDLWNSGNVKEKFQNLLNNDFAKQFGIFIFILIILWLLFRK